MIKKFNEDGTACVNASVGGMGNVVIATVGSLPGVPGAPGSGDRGNVLGTYTKQPVSDDPANVSDLRYLKRPKNKKIKKVKEI